MSFLVTRPPWPVPGTEPTSTPCSAAMRATTGETNVLPLPLTSARRGRAARRQPGQASRRSTRRRRLAAASAVARLRRRRLRRGLRLGCCRRPPRLRGAITASFVPTSTVSPSWTRIFWTTPVPGLGTSVSTLSVEISSSGSSASIASPSLLQPLRDRPLRDGDAHLRHDDVDRGPGRHQYAASSLSPATTVVDLRDVRLLERRRERHGRVGRGDPLHRRVERLERLLGDRRRDLGAEAAGARVLVEDEHLRGLARRSRAPPPCPTAARVRRSMISTETSSLLELAARPRRPCRPSRPR